MTFSVSDVVVEARELVLDTLAPYRYSTEFIVRRVNQVLKRACILRPDLFTSHTSITCVDGILQSCPADSVRIIDVVTNSTGYAVKEVTQDVLGLLSPDWQMATSAPATDWMRYPRDPNRFYVFPKATAGDAMSIIYVKSPVTLLSSDTVPLPDAYYPAIIDGTCWLLEAIDAEHVESGRAKSFKDGFESALSSGYSLRRVSDTDSAGQNKDEVIA